MTENLYTIIVSLILIVIVAFIIKGLINDHKKGIQSGCGGNCSECGISCLHNVKLPKKL